MKVMLVLAAAFLLVGCGAGLSSKEQDQAADIAADVAHETVSESEKLSALEDRLDDLEARIDELETAQVQ